jgi:formylglycine-generating enzyme required for sulfatase activity
VRVDEGWFLSGCAVVPRTATRRDAVWCAGANPPRRLWASAFEIDETEVTVQAFETCVAAKVCSETKQTYPPIIRPAATTPAVVRFEQADQYCAWQGKRLPTEAEWEKAARGTDGRMYPWGNEMPTCATAAISWDPVNELRFQCPKGWRIATVASHPQDRSPYGAMDMAGNAAEWTSDLLVPDRGDWRDQVTPGTVRFADPIVVDPQGPTAEAYAASAHRRAHPGLKHVMRGGHSNGAIGTRTQVPMGFDEDDHPIGGFRCVRSLASGPAPQASPVLEATVTVVEAAGGGFEIKSSALAQDSK